MLTGDQTRDDGATSAGAPVHRPSGLAGAIVDRLMSWAKTCADYHVASAEYERLSGLSDAELNRRGLSRSTLARDVRLAHDSH